MKVIFLGDSIYMQDAGIHYFGLQLIRWIIKTYPDHHYSIVLPAAIPELDVEQIIVPVQSRNPFHLRWRQLTSIPNLINRLLPDIVVELAHFGPFYLKSQIKRITVIHDLTPIKYPQFHPWISVVFHRLLLPAIVRNADFIIVNSDQTKRDLIAWSDKSREEILVFPPRAPDFPQNDVQDQVQDRPYFLTVGTREPRKNQTTIVKAFEKFCEVNNDYDLVIAGGPGWKNQQFDLAYQNSPVRDRIKLTGYVSRNELASLYRKAHVFIFASLYEGYGIPILEALSFSLPLLLGDNESLPLPAREAALIFPCHDSDVLFQHMAQIIQSPDLYDNLKVLSRSAYKKQIGHLVDLDRIFKS